MTKVDWTFSSGEHAEVKEKEPLLCCRSPWRMASGRCGGRGNRGSGCRVVALQGLGFGACQNWASAQPLGCGQL